jgi:hypothetical protein
LTARESREKVNARLYIFVRVGMVIKYQVGYGILVAIIKSYLT